MEHASPMHAWETFYVIVGSSGAALTGLQFVVITLIADDDSSQADSPEVRAFGTPTVMHFSAALLIAALACAPWPGLASAGWALAACGAGGVALGVNVIRTARVLTRYKAVLEDWIWHAVLPLIGYSVLLAGGLALPHSPGPSLFAIAAVALLLVFIGIHNAWDTVLYVAGERARRRSESKKAGEAP